MPYRFTLRVTVGGRSKRVRFRVLGSVDGDQMKEAAAGVSSRKEGRVTG